MIKSSSIPRSPADEGRTTTTTTANAPTLTCRTAARGEAILGAQVSLRVLEEAYQYLKTPDAALGLASYAATLVLAGMGSGRRAEERPWIRLALAAKVGLDIMSALSLTVEQGSKHRRFWLGGASWRPV